MGLLGSEHALAAEPEVPIRLQVSLLDRVIPYDRNFAAVRVHGQVVVAIVVDAASADSTRVGTLLQSELSSLATLGGHALSVARIALASPQVLVEDCKRLKAGVAYFTPGVREPIAKLAASLVGLRVLTAGTMPEHAAEGAVLCSAVRSGKPRVLINLTQAKLQEVDFRADFLRMAEVVG